MLGAFGWELLFESFRLESFWFVLGAFGWELSLWRTFGMCWELLAGSFRLRAFVCELLVCCGSCWLGAFIMENFWHVLGAFGWELSFESFRV